MLIYSYGANLLVLCLFTWYMHNIHSFLALLLGSTHLFSYPTLLHFFVWMNSIIWHQTTNRSGKYTVSFIAILVNNNNCHWKLCFVMAAEPPVSVPNLIMLCSVSITPQTEINQWRIQLTFMLWYYSSDALCLASGLHLLALPLRLLSLWIITRLSSFKVNN